MNVDGYRTLVTVIRLLVDHPLELPRALELEAYWPGVNERLEREPIFTIISEAIDDYEARHFSVTAEQRPS